MININRLIGNIKDHDQILYSSLKESLEKGVLFTNIPSNKITKEFISLFEKKHTIQATADVLEMVGLEMTLLKHYYLRSKLGSPFLNRVFFKKDLVEIRYFPKENKIFVRKIQDDPERVSTENHENLFDTDLCFQNCKELMASKLRFMAADLTSGEGRITKIAAELLEFFGLLKMDEFKFKNERSTNKGSIPNYQVVVNRINQYCLNFRWPKYYSFIHAYYERQNLDKYDFELMHKRLDYWNQKNIQFWKKGDVHYKRLHQQYFNYGSY